MRILGIESSCDDTSISLMDCSEQGHFVVSEKTASQIDIHKKYGGVVPEIAGRMHAEKIVPLIEEILKDQPKPDAIAVTSGPGLITGLIVGVEAARALSYSLRIPLISTNHMEGHIHSVEIPNKKITFPAVALVVSGGHTELILIKNRGEYELIGKTKDDAAGECFDKIAKLLSLPYPGGPQISKLALTGDTATIKFPRPMLNEDNFDFSFSGLKTSALYWLRDHKLRATQKNIWQKIFNFKNNKPAINDFCASFEQAIVDVLVGKTLKAVKKYRPQTVILAGGVSANQKLRDALETLLKKEHPTTQYLYPELKYCMDNAGMIAAAGYYQAQKGNYTDWRKIKANPNWELI